jgi:cold-inducible RNA-binding protein
MTTKLFVGNIPFKLTEEDLERLFSESGKVVSVSMPLDRDTGRKRGFAFVEMGSEAEAEKAVEQLNGSNVDGRDLVVNPSKPRERTSAGNNNRYH